MSRLPSIGLEWSDSDSSVDSMPDSDSDLEGDWPRETGFMVRTYTCVFLYSTLCATVFAV